MRMNNLRSEYKSLFYACSILLTILTGCSDSGENKEGSKESVSLPSKADTTQKIEVVKNENALEIKVAQKESDDNQSKSYYLNYNTNSNYDLNSQPANSDASVKDKPRTTIDANMHVRSPYEKVQVSMMVKQFSKNFIIKCSACHNDYANGVIGPSLLGKDSDYIFDKIAAFKKGTKKNVLMEGLISQMDDKEIRELANEINQFNNMIKEMRK
jgi:cytochrome c553